MVVFCSDLFKSCLVVSVGVHITSRPVCDTFAVVCMHLPASVPACRVVLPTRPVSIILQICTSVTSVFKSSLITGFFLLLPSIFSLVTCSIGVNSLVAHLPTRPVRSNLKCFILTYKISLG
jgi:hypothetical protein